MRPMMARTVHTIPIGNLLILDSPNRLCAQCEAAFSPYPWCAMSILGVTRCPTTIVTPDPSQGFPMTMVE